MAIADERFLARFQITYIPVIGETQGQRNLQKNKRKPSKRQIVAQRDWRFDTGKRRRSPGSVQRKMPRTTGVGAGGSAPCRART